MLISPIRRVVGVVAVAAVLSVSGCGQESAQSLMAGAQADLAKKDPRSAVVRLKQALQMDPNAHAARELLGRAMLDAGDPASAGVELAKGLDHGADTNSVMPILARAMLQSGQYKKLLELYGDVKLSNKTADANFRTSLATAWALAGDRPKTEAAIKAVLTAVPDFPPALILQARLTAGRGEFAASLELVDKVLALAPKLQEAWQLKGEIQTHGLRDSEAAQLSFRKALEIDKTFVPAYLALIAAKIRAGDIVAATEQFEVLRKLAPNLVETEFLQAQLAFYNKQYDSARELTQRLLRVLPEHTGALQLLSALEWQAGSPTLAARPLETALQLDPGLDAARVNLAYVYLRLGQAARALDVLKPLTEVEGTPARVLAAAAEASLQLGRLDDAESFYSRAASAAPDDSRSRTALALTRLAKGEAANAFNQLESLAVQSKELYVDAALVSARLKQGDLKEALASANNLLRKAPDNAFAFELQGRVLMATGDLNAARLAFEEALKRIPSLIYPTLSLAEIDVRQGRPDQAIARAHAFVKAQPRTFGALLLLADVRSKVGAAPAEVQDAITQAIAAAPSEVEPRLKLIELLADNRQLTAALVAAQEAVAAIPNNLRLLDALGKMQFASGDKQQALTTFRSIIALDPSNVTAHVRMADVYRLSGDTTAAVAELRRAVELDPLIKSARLALVELLLSQKRQKEAIDIAKTLQRREPRSAGGYLLEGAIQRKLGNHAASVAIYREGLQKAADQAELTINLYAGLMIMGNRKEAETLGLQWLAKNPGDGGMHFQLGEFYTSARAYATAETHLAKAVGIRPDFAPALNNLAWVLAQQGKPGAVELARRALQLQPNQPTYLDTLATTLAADKRMPEALETQRKAVQIAPDDLTLRMRLAELAVATGDKGLAKSELERVVAVQSRNPYRDEAMRRLKAL